MEVEKISNILWTQLAIKNLQQIHKFYIKIANKEVANKIVDELFSNVKTLEQSSFIGQLEATLKNLKKNIVI